MKRRDFLLFRSTGDERSAELSCQQLFIHYQDLCSEVGQAKAESGTLDEADWWAGEPPLNIPSIAPENFFRSVQSKLLSVRKLRVLDMEWMGQGEFRIRVETLLAAFKAAGGEVSYGDQPDSEKKMEKENELQ